MPETAMNENDFLCARENNVGTPNYFRRMEAITKAKRMNQFSDSDFGFCVLVADTTHPLAPLFSRQRVHRVLLHPIEGFLEEREITGITKFLTRTAQLIRTSPALTLSGAVHVAPFPRAPFSAFSRALLVHVAPLPAGSIHGSDRSKESDELANHDAWAKAGAGGLVPPSAAAAKAPSSAS